MTSVKNWTDWAIDRIRADAHRSADTHLLRLPFSTGVTAYFKDESTHPTGSLKHRLARSLVLYAICNGELRPDMPLIEASSGSTAISLAYFARLIDVPFIAVIPRSTSAEKIAAITKLHGEVHFCEGNDPTDTAASLADELTGHFCDQFNNAAIATDWRGNNNIAESAFAQLAQEEHPVPRWVVMAAGTGGTTATFGRWIRYQSLASQLCLPDPEGSVFHHVWQQFPHNTRDLQQRQSIREAGSRIEGIGRPCWQLSFMPQLIDHAAVVPDAASCAGMQIVSELLGKSVGITTGTHFVQVVRLAAQMQRGNESGSILSVICDSGERYRSSFADPTWCHQHGLHDAAWHDALRRFIDHGVFEEPV